MSSFEYLPLRQRSRQQHQRSQIKEQQRREKELAEMSAFFDLKETPEEQITATAHGQLHEDNKYWEIKKGFGSDDRKEWCEGQRRHTRNSTEEKRERSNQQQMLQDKEVNESIRRLRPSRSRATSYTTWSTSNNRQTLLPDRTGTRHPSSTPEPVREALRETGVFNGTGILGKDCKSEADLLRANLCRQIQALSRNQNCKSNELDRNPPIVQVERPTIVRYQNKGVMAVSNPLPPLLVAGSHDLSIQTAANNKIGRGIQAECEAGLSHVKDTSATRADIAAQTYLGPQYKQISTQTSPSTTQERSTRAHKTDVVTYSTSKDFEAHAATAEVYQPSTEATSTFERLEEMADKLKNRQTGRPDPATTSISRWNSNEGNLSTPSSDLLAQDSATHCRSAFPSVNVTESDPTNQFRTETSRHSSESMPFPRAVPQLLSDGYQPKRLYYDLNAQGHGSTSRSSASRFQSLKSTMDFITRADQDTRGNQNQDFIYDGDITLRRNADHLETAPRCYDWQHTPRTEATAISRYPEVPGWYHLENAGAIGARVEQYPDAESYVQPDRNYHHPWQHQPVNQATQHEQEEMHAFWRPNYFY